MVTNPPASHADTDTHTELHRPETVRELWLGVLLAPVAFLSGMIALYALSAPECARRHDLIMHCIHAATVLIGLTGLLIAWSTHRVTAHSKGATALGPGVRFLSRAAIGSSTLFVLVMLVQWFISFVYAPC
jgi:hypothetical protein